MSFQSTRRIAHQVALMLCATAVAGCACWQCPRIDPSGERICIWPNQAQVAGAPVVAAPPPGATVIPATPVIAPAVAPVSGIGAPMGNVQAPPVFSDPVPVVAPTMGTMATPAAPGTVVPGTAAPVAAVSGAPIAAQFLTTMRPAGCPGMATPIGTCAPQGVCYLRVTPNGILAPIGAEVVVKAGVANCDGSLLVNQQVDWGISGAGQFTELGASYQVGNLLWPWQAPRRIAANHATSTTAVSESTLFIGTPDPNDDVPIYRGEAWVTLTSACEGTSLVTAYAPSLPSHNRVTVPIYWVDAHFLFPPSAMAEPGRPHVLTTTVLRRSDNAPLAGWTVRYDVAQGASLGYEGGNFVEARTDAAGRASVEVSPVSSGGGTTNVGVSIFRPAVGGPGGTPPLGLGRGMATITWGAGLPVAGAAPPTVITPGVTVESDPATPGLSPYSPYSQNQIPTSRPGISPPPAGPAVQPEPAAPTPDRYTPPAGESTTGRAKLDVEMRLLTPAQTAVGEYARFELVISNSGNATARGVKLRDDFPVGLRHESAQPGETTIVNSSVRDIPPNQSTTVMLTFEVVAEGQHCHTVTVTAEGADAASKQGCVGGIKPAIAAFRITGHVSRTVGEKAQFDILIKNGELPARNVAVVLKFDPALEPIAGANPALERLQDGSVMLKIGDLAPNEQRTFKQQPIEALCKADNRNACVQADLTVGGSFVVADQACVDILPAAPGGAGVGTPGGAG